MMSTNTDHFTPLASQYASFRHFYPEELFDWLAGIALLQRMAWDCDANPVGDWHQAST
jgi:hypothetical protein